MTEMMCLNLKLEKVVDGTKLNKIEWMAKLLQGCSSMAKMGALMYENW